MRWKQGSKKDESKLVLRISIKSCGKKLRKDTRVDTIPSFVQRIVHILFAIWSKLDRYRSMVLITVYAPLVQIVNA